MNTFVQRYRNELGLCRQRFEALDLRKEKGYQFKFTMFSANLQNILPDIPTHRHEALFRELLLQQVYTTFDQQFITANDLVRTTGPLQRLLQQKRPNIYCTFHLGSYRLLTTYLFRQGVDCALMVGSRVFREQGDEMHATIERLRRKHRLTNTFKLLDAESTASTLQVIRELRAGTSLVIYIDGLTSKTGEPHQEDKEIRVRLGHQRVWTRKGVAFLSHVTQTPIVPVFSYREDDDHNVLAFESPIDPARQPDREAYCQESLQSLYDHFGTYLARYPGQWEGWTYVHNFFDEDKFHHPMLASVPLRTRKRVAFNQDRYTLCDLEDAPVLFDRRLYVTYEISPDLRDFLLQAGTTEAPEEVLGSDLYQDLLSRQILV